MWGLHQICHIQGHLFDGGVIERFNVSQDALVFVSDHVDGHSLSAKTASSSDPEGTRTNVLNEVFGFNMLCSRLSSITSV